MGQRNVLQTGRNKMICVWEGGRREGVGNGNEKINIEIDVVFINYLCARMEANNGNTEYYS